jgi:hypothetical protein
VFDERERERESETDRKTEGQKERETERETEREIERQRNIKIREPSRYFKDKDGQWLTTFHRCTRADPNFIDENGEVEKA